MGERRRQAVHPPALVVHQHEDVGAEPARGRREREHGVEARAVAREEDDAPKPDPLRQRPEVVRDPRALEADGERLAGPRRHSRPPRLVMLPIGLLQ
jgi:hypothetical protein